jgi:hypothetical protein
VAANIRVDQVNGFFNPEARRRFKGKRCRGRYCQKPE